MSTIARSSVKTEDMWNVQALFPNLDTWKVHFAHAKADAEILNIDKMAELKGKLGDNANNLLFVIEKLFEGMRYLEKLYTYAHLRHDEDTANNTPLVALKNITSLIQEYQEKTAWIEPEILTIEKSKLEQFMASPSFIEWQFYLEKLLHLREHTLSPDKEELLAQASQALTAPSKIFRAINDADFSFGHVKDSDNKKHLLTHGSYLQLIKNQDRTLREHAFKAYHNKFKEYENSITEMLNGHVQYHLFNSRARKYPSCLHAALFNKNIDPKVYHTLIDTIHNNLHVLHKYVALRKKLLGLDEIHLYDMYVPLLPNVNIKRDYQTAEQEVIEAAAPLGQEYQELLKHGLQHARWVDRYENKNKRSGAYSSGCYDSEPYILMNFHGDIREEFTLMHEAGHSMHSLLSAKNQPYQYYEYPIFVAEVASTFNEELLRSYLLKKTTDKNEKIYLLNQAIEDIRATLFRQVMFAEFELLIHKLAQQQIPLTPTILKDEFYKLNLLYFGDDAVVDKEIAIEWARIPHFYSNFYVYQYATGISAALTLADRVLNGGNEEKENYLNFLKSGGSKYPIDLLKTAGVNMLSPEPVEKAIHYFDMLIGEMNRLI